jgi:undecaprenyl-diphosphatase
MATVRGAAGAAVRWVLSRDLAVLLAVLLVVVCVLGFLRLADAVTEGHTLRTDERILRALRDPSDPARLAGRWPDEELEVAHDVTALGSVSVLTLVTLITVGYLLICRMHHAVWLLLLAVVGGTVLSFALKDYFERPRPEVVPRLAAVQSPSFPSGHSFMSAVVYLTLGSLLDRFVRPRRVKLYFLAVAILLTALVGCSRVVLGVHYPTDVLGGWAAGLTWATLCWLLARQLQHRGAVEKDTA